METKVTESKAAKRPVFATKAKVELYWAMKQLIKFLTILIVLSLLLNWTRSYSEGLVLLLALIGFFMLLVTFVYFIGHLVRYFIYRARGQ